MPTRSAFATQANALLRKNAVVQLKNWRVTRGVRDVTRRRAARPPETSLVPPPDARRRKTNACLVLTPLLFSLVLGGARARAQRRGALHGRELTRGTCAAQC
jgi:hypothetical protein